jgi:hypothetical protein
VIVTRLVGGLGNQMFQYAVGRHLALRRGTTLRLDLSWFQNVPPGDTPRRYALAPYGLDAELDGWTHVRRRPAAGHGFAGRALRRFGTGLGKVVVDRAAGFRRDVLDAPDGTLLIGYWQSERYFRDVGSVVRDDLRLADPPRGREAAVLEAVRAAPSVSLHVRRGDYLTNPAARRLLAPPGLGYYRAALALVAEQVEGLHVFVFSDDHAWCEANLDLGHRVTHVAHNGDAAAHEDLRLMAACRHHVLANSSFSWWGAWLEPEPGGIVVAPRRWVLDPTGVPDVHAEGWIRL